MEDPPADNMNPESPPSQPLHSEDASMEVPDGLHQKPYEGLIFDDHDRFTREVGIREGVARKLLGVHLMNEEQILGKLEDNAKEIIDPSDLKETTTQIRKYLKDNNHLLVLTQEELSKEFPNFDQNQLEILEGVDLSDMELVEDSTEKLEAQGAPEDSTTSLLREVDNYVDKKIRKDLVDKAKSEGKTHEWLKYENPEELMEKVELDEKAAQLLLNIHPLWERN